MFSEFGYCCPHCTGNLRVDQGIKFQVEKENQDKVIMFLSPVPFDYSYSSWPEMVFQKGEQLLFRCNSCHIDLQSEDHPELVRIQLVVTERISFDVYFSPICGDKQTYIEMQGVLERYSGNLLAFNELRKAG